MERGPFWIRLWIIIIKDRCIALQHKCLLCFFFLIVNCTWFYFQSVQCLYRFVWMISKNFFLSIFLCEIFNVHLIGIRLRIAMTRSPTRQRFSWATIYYHDLFINHDDPSTIAKQFLCARSFLSWFIYESWWMETKRFELSTPCLQGRCSPNWAKPPFKSGSHLLSHAVSSIVSSAA